MKVEIAIKIDGQPLGWKTYTKPTIEEIVTQVEAVLDKNHVPMLDLDDLRGKDTLENMLDEFIELEDLSHEIGPQ